MKKMLMITFVLLTLVMLMCNIQALAEETADEVIDLGDIRMGGWSLSENPAMTEKDMERFDKAMEGLVGVGYTPMLCLGTQIVSGTNYCYLCRAQVVYPDAEPYYALVYIYEDLSGQASILDIQTLELGLS